MACALCVDLPYVRVRGSARTFPQGPSKQTFHVGPLCV